MVVGHRGRYGVDVEVTQPPTGQAAFIDFVLLAEPGQPMTPDRLPSVGSVLEAVVAGFAPNGELRLDATPSIVERWKQRGQ